MLEVRGLKKSYRELEVLKGVSFSVEPGETVVIMGPSGCGKSTTIRCINRLTEPDAGEVIFKGQNITGMRKEDLLKVREDIGFVFQNFNLIRRLNVLDNVTLGLRLKGIAPEEARSRALQALKQVGLEGKLKAYPDNLSGGEKQRVGVARALAQNPSLILMDEPTASLDPILVGEVLQVLEDLTSSRDKSLVIVTHEVAFALRVADRILLMDEGRIVESGPPHLVFRNPGSWVGEKYKEMMAYNS